MALWATLKVASTLIYILALFLVYNIRATIAR